MKRLLHVLLLWALMLVLPAAHATWNADWQHRLRLGLNTSADGLNLPNGAESVPVLVRLHTGNFSFVDARPDGADLRFIANDDKTPLKFHVEKFDGLNELALVWVQVPKLAAASKDDFIWLYYGNEKANTGADAKTSYDNAQALVYHFGEKDGLPQDSTAFGHHAARLTAKAAGSGLIGGGLVFDGASDLGLIAAPGLKSGAGGLTLTLWLKPTALADATLFAQDSATGLKLLLKGGKLVAQVGAAAATSSAELAVGSWQHVAVTVKDGIAVFVNGNEVARAAGSFGELGGSIAVGKGYQGELDELGLASTARTPEWIRAVALSQGEGQKLVAYGQPEAGEAEEGASYLKILLSAVTLDGWVVIGILMVMFVISIYVMVDKIRFVGIAARDNGRFKAQFDAFVDGLKPGADNEAAEQAVAKGFRQAQLYRLYASGAHELRQRFTEYAKAGREMVLTDASINAIRASIDATLVREMQRLNSKMVLLTIAIAGGPFLGLLGTVVGVMITFAAIAAAGDVNVNAIAPGIAAALVATVAGLAVAIPALFAYNYLNSRIADLSADMQVFVDEFITRIAENHSV
jgi:biopolymer transport protein ExbB